jgi:LruC domain-containing protein
MKKTFTTRTFGAVATLMMLLFLSSCKKEINSPASSPASDLRLGEVVLPSTFNFSTYSMVDLELTCSPNTTFKIKGKYGSQADVLGTYFSSSSRLQKQLEIPAFYEDLIIEAYSDKGKKEMKYSLNQPSTLIQSDFTGSFKTSTAVIPTNVLYAVNSNKDFLVVKTSDYSYETLPSLSAGSIACAVDTFNNLVYYHNGGKMYQYDIETQVHSIAYSNANPFGSGNFPRMEFDCTTQHLFMSNGSTSIKEVDPSTGTVISSYTIQGLVNGSGGGDLTFPPNGKRYLACFSGLYELDFTVGNGIVQATRISAENMPYQLTSAGYDRQGFLYAFTNDAQSMMLKLDPQDGSYIVVKTFPMKINDLGSVVSFSSSICTADSDNDGICDELDDFPVDSTVCCAQYTPSELGSGSLAFEDLWPSTGDYDFNDLVIGYNYIEMRNTSDELVKIKAKFQVKAVGASYHNGFGFQLNLNPNDIKSVSGASLGQGITTADSKGLEVGQSTTTIIAFEDSYDVIDHVGGAYINTDPNQPVSIGQVVEIIIELNQPLNVSAHPENPFIFVDGNRGHEVHLADNPPTDLADITLFGLLRDKSDPNTGRYYKDENNVPWAIDISHNFRYPREKNRVDEGYNFMVNWAMSQGNSYKDWYKDNSGYRNVNKLYMKHQ